VKLDGAGGQQTVARGDMLAAALALRTALNAALAAPPGRAAFRRAKIRRNSGVKIGYILAY
jgi:hypothetical protein